MAEPKEIVARRFPGTDTETDPLELGAKYLEGEGVMWTNDARDIYGDGSFVQRRPGVRLCTGLSAITSPPVYDLVRLALTEAAGIAGATGNDVLAGLYLDASNRATVILFTVGTLPAVTTATARTDADFMNIAILSYGCNEADGCPRIARVGLPTGRQAGKGNSGQPIAQRLRYALRHALCVCHKNYYR